MYFPVRHESDVRCAHCAPLGSPAITQMTPGNHEFLSANTRASGQQGREQKVDKDDAGDQVVWPCLIEPVAVQRLPYRIVSCAVRSRTIEHVSAMVDGIPHLSFVICEQLLLCIARYGPEAVHRTGVSSLSLSYNTMYGTWSACYLQRFRYYYTLPWTTLNVVLLQSRG
jgi:hypothetical protein